MNLELATTEELIDELNNRTEAGIVCVDVQASADDDGEGAAGKRATYRRWWGNEHTCLGLACDFQNVLADDLLNERRVYLGNEPDDDEED